MSKHALERATERGVSVDNINDALRNPVKIGPIKIDNGLPSVKYFGGKAVVTINPNTNKVITTWPTSSTLKH